MARKGLGVRSRRWWGSDGNIDVLESWFKGLRVGIVEFGRIDVETEWFVLIWYSLLELLVFSLVLAILFLASWWSFDASPILFHIFYNFLFFSVLPWTSLAILICFFDASGYFLIFCMVARLLVWAEAVSSYDSFGLGWTRVYIARVRTSKPSGGLEEDGYCGPWTVKRRGRRNKVKVNEEV